jgi:tetratricopeptide (TPR) repeat protein
MPPRSAEAADSSARYLILPEAPAEQSGPVKAWEQEMEILTYAPGAPDRNPMFLEGRVYQGSSGRVYPLPFIDRIATTPVPKLWKAIHIENEYLRLMIMPEIGGRIHIGYDKTTNYDFFYRQNVIKPALVGLAGPWVSGGVEFNWPQHHRPATFMPVTTSIEREQDGSVTIWCSDHDPMLRMKGMHGVCLRPGRAALELKVRLYNRTPFTQTFLWWANAATRVHEQYQSFFPQDVRSVADHAKRAVTSFPLSEGRYYGVNYGERARTGVPQGEISEHFVPDGSYPANDLSWYSNIPVPTSYMITGTEHDFFGGYDHKADAGVVHVANHHISPGKKQWTWGNHEFGYAWDRNLTDHDGPYIELMAGVYTDNQPDFSWLAPWETRAFTQNWYPIHSIGSPVAANTDAALSIHGKEGSLRIGVCVTAPIEDATIILKHVGAELARWTRSVTPSAPLVIKAPLPSNIDPLAAGVLVYADKRLIIGYDPAQIRSGDAAIIAKEPKRPEDVESIEELYLIGLHLEQYRHATRSSRSYWAEGLRRDPSDSRICNAMGLWHLRGGEFEQAAEHFCTAIARLTALNPNPRDGEPYYNLGLAYRYMGRDKEAYDAFYKATWNGAWRAPAYFALAECDAARQNWRSAIDHVELSLRSDADNLNARNLLAIALRRIGETQAADRTLDDVLALDPLDITARWQRHILPANGQECLDLAFDLMRAGLYEDALDILRAADLKARDGSVPIVLLALAYAQDKLALSAASDTFQLALDAPIDYCFPSRLEEMLILEWAHAKRSSAWMPSYLLGNLLYDRRRYQNAIKYWESACAQNPSFARVHRNLGIAYFNVHHDSNRALSSFESAFAANPHDARVLYERDQLWKRTGRSPQQRLDELQQHPALVEVRDDLSLELATLLNHVGRPSEALDLLLGRRFQPWEGGEGLVLGQYVRARILLGRHALDIGGYTEAREHFFAALKPPDNLSEATHLLANQSDIHFWIGESFHRSGNGEQAHEWWTRAARQNGDFQQMSGHEISDMTFWTGMALQRLDRVNEAANLLTRIHDYAVELVKRQPQIDYFATSLPAMLLFNEDLALRNRISSLFLRAQAAAGLKRTTEAKSLFQEVLGLDASHAGAADLLRDSALTGARDSKAENQ